MPSSTRTYTQDCQEVLAYIQHHGKHIHENDTSIQADTVFWSVYKCIKDKKYTQLFWRFLGIHSYIRMGKLYKKQIASQLKRTQPQTTHVSQQEADRIVQTLANNLRTSLQELHDHGISKISMMSLFYIAIKHLSPKLQKQLQAIDIDIQKLERNVNIVISNDSLTSMGIFAFLKAFRKILTDLHLHVKDIDMVHMSDTDQKSIEELSEYLDSQVPSDNYESDVMDRSSTSGDGDTAQENEHKMTIEHFGIDLTNEASKDNLDPCIGRDKEIEQLQYTLLRKTKNNPLLIGEAGVGKTAIVEGFAHKIVQGDVPEKLQNKKIFMLDMGTLVAGTKYRGEFESRFKAIMEEAADITNNIIVFIDEIHTIIGAGSGDKTGDAAQLLKPMLARGKIKLIGATTFDEYQQHIESDAALKRRFQEITVNEPDRETTKEILV